MELNDVDKQSLLGPIINEVGIIPASLKQKIIEQIGNQIDRILIKSYKKSYDEIIGNIQLLQHDIQTIHNKIDKISIQDTTSKVEIEVVRKNDCDEYRNELISLSFVDVLKKAKNNMIDVKPRMKKLEIIDLLILEKEKENGK